MGASHLACIGILALNDPIACHDKVNGLVYQCWRLAAELETEWDQPLAALLRHVRSNHWTACVQHKIKRLLNYSLRYFYPALNHEQ